MNPFDEDNGRWYLAILSIQGRLTNDQKYQVYCVAAEMQLKEQQIRSISRDTIEARVTTDGTSWSLGGFSGRRYEAVVETSHGTAQMRLLLSDVTERAREGRKAQRRHYVN
jgi:hypothetical protein